MPDKAGDKGTYASNDRVTGDHVRRPMVNIHQVESRLVRNGERCNMLFFLIALEKIKNKCPLANESDYNRSAE